MRLYHGKYWHPQILVEEELATPAITQINPQHQQGQTHHSMYSILCLYFARQVTLCIVYFACTLPDTSPCTWCMSSTNHHPILCTHLDVLDCAKNNSLQCNDDVQSSKRVEDGLADRSNEVWAGIWHFLSGHAPYATVPYASVLCSMCYMQGSSSTAPCFLSGHVPGSARYVQP